jgi:hypothetical protein
MALLPALFLGLFATLFLALPAAQAAEPAADTAAGATDDEAVVTVFDRPIAVFRAPLFGLSPAARASRTQGAIRELLARGGPGVVTAQKEPQGNVVLIDGALALVLTPQDVDTVRRETLDAATQASVAALTNAIAETREARDRGKLLRALGFSALATLLFLLATWGVLRARNAPRGADGATAGARRRTGPPRPAAAVGSHAGPRVRQLAGTQRRLAAAGPPELPVAGVRAAAVPRHAGARRADGRLRARPAGGHRSGRRARVAGPDRRGGDLPAGPGADRDAAAPVRPRRAGRGVLGLAGPRPGPADPAPGERGHLAVRAGDGLSLPAGIAERGLQGHVGAGGPDDHAGRLQPDRAGLQRPDPDVFARAAPGEYVRISDQEGTVVDSACSPRASAPGWARR